MAVHQNFSVGLNTSDYERAARRLVDISGRSAREMADRWRASAGRGPAEILRGGPRGGNGSGGVAVQIQDIAVQLQSGTKLATIFAQQGSQLASVFGPQGAIIGGVIAIIGFLEVMSDANTKLVDESKELAKNIDASEYSFSGLADNIGKATKNLKALNESSKTKRGENGIMAGIGDAIEGGYRILRGKGGTRSDEIKANARTEELEQAAIIRGQEYLINLGENEAAMAELFAQGKDKEAAAMKDALKYAEEMLKISGLQVDEDTKNDLRNSEARKYAAQVQKRIYDDQQKAIKETVEKEKALTSEREKQSGIQQQISEVSLSDEQKIARLRMVQQSALRATTKDPEAMAKARTTVAESELKIVVLAKGIADRARAAEIKSYHDQEEAQMRAFENYQKEGALRLQILDEVEKRQRQIQYAVGDEINAAADKIQTPYSEQKSQARADRARTRAIRTAAERAVNKEDDDQRKFGRGITGLTDEQKKTRKQRFIDAANAAKNRDKIETKLAPDSIDALVKAIADLQTK